MYAIQLSPSQFIQNIIFEKSVMLGIHGKNDSHLGWLGIIWGNNGEFLNMDVNPA